MKYWLPASFGDYVMAAIAEHRRKHHQGMNIAATLLRLESMPDLDKMRKGWIDLLSRDLGWIAKFKHQWNARHLNEVNFRDLKIPPFEIKKEKFHFDKVILALNKQDILEGYPLRVVIYDESPGAHVLLYWDHSIMDGVGVNYLLKNWLGISVNHATKNELIFPDRISFHDRLMQAQKGHNVMKELTNDGVLSVWRKKDTYFGSKSCFAVREYSVEETQVLHHLQNQYCGEFFQMPFYAALSSLLLSKITLSRNYQQKNIHLEIPVQSKKRGEASIFGNQMSPFLMVIRIECLSNIEQACEHLMDIYKTQSKLKIASCRDHMMYLMSRLPHSYFFPIIRMLSRGELCSLFHSHTGEFLKGVNEWYGAKIDQIMTIPTVSNPPGLGIFFAEYQGRMTAVLSWRDDALDDHEANSMFDCLDRIIAKHIK
jgi:hypothetical protein